MGEQPNRSPQEIESRVRDQAAHLLRAKIPATSILRPVLSRRNVSLHLTNRLSLQSLAVLTRYSIEFLPFPKVSVCDVV